MRSLLSLKQAPFFIPKKIKSFSDLKLFALFAFFYAPPSSDRVCVYTDTVLSKLNRSFDQFFSDNIGIGSWPLSHRRTHSCTDRQTDRKHTHTLTHIQTGKKKGTHRNKRTHPQTGRKTAHAHAHAHAHTKRKAHTDRHTQTHTHTQADMCRQTDRQARAHRHTSFFLSLSLSPSISLFLCVKSVFSQGWITRSQSYTSRDQIHPTRNPILDSNPVLSWHFAADNPRSRFLIYPQWKDSTILPSENFLSLQIGLVRSWGYSHSGSSYWGLRHPQVTSNCKQSCIFGCCVVSESGILRISRPVVFLLRKTLFLSLCNALLLCAT